MPTQARAALEIAERVLPGSIAAAFLHGSAVAGGLRPDSDVDLLLVLEGPVSTEDRRRLVAELMRLSCYPAVSDAGRPIELIAFLRADLAAGRYPARAEFVYGEWLRAGFEAGNVPDPEADPEYTLLLAQARLQAQTLKGADLPALTPPISEHDVRRATGGALPGLLRSIEGDERNVLLTLARMWRTLATGDFVAKDEAARWARSRIAAGDAALLEHARLAYLGHVADDWSAQRGDAFQLAQRLAAQIRALVSS